MKNILVAGLVNIETTCRIDHFPLHYFPVTYPFDGVRSTVSGVGFNVALALRTLGNEVRLLTLLGNDAMADLAGTVIGQHLATDGVVRSLQATPQSVILYEQGGRRQIHVDLKNIQEQSYPATHAEKELRQADLAVLCNIGFARALLEPARSLHLPIATDVHALGHPDDEYNADFMRAAQVLFVSNEHFAGHESDMLHALMDRYPCTHIICGMGAHGALMLSREHGQRHIHHEAAATTRPAVNTVGAGDALFAAFVHSLAAGLPPGLCLQRAVYFASWKIGSQGAAEGFLDEAALRALLPP